MRSRPAVQLTLVALWLGACANHNSEAKAMQPPPPPPPAPSLAKADTPTDVAPPEALAAPPAAAPTGLAGLDLSGLDPSQVEALNRLLDEKPSACGKSHSLRTSLKTDPACKRSGYGARYLVKMLKAGLLGSEAEELYDKRFISPEQGRCDLDDVPLRGDAKASVTMCEFSDFQCPHCRLMEPVLSKLLEDYPGQVKLYYKNYPISKLHPEARDAAAAAVAAGRQGKFWAMHDKLFSNQDHLTQADLERYARELKLDVTKWKADLAKASDRVEKDHSEGEKLDITGTPTLYINGRKYSGPLRYEEVKDWVDEELNR
jgi:predicted DsbA family dithiol-disulfide isomerase